MVTSYHATTRKAPKRFVKERTERNELRGFLFVSDAARNYSDADAGLRVLQPYNAFYCAFRRNQVQLDAVPCEQLAIAFRCVGTETAFRVERHRHGTRRRRAKHRKYEPNQRAGDCDCG